MKKLLTAILSVLMVFSIAGTNVFAEDDTKTTEVSHTIESGYEWSVPSGTKTITTTEATIGNVEVTKCVLEDGKQLNITVASTNGFNVKSGSNSITYTLAKTSGGTALKNNDSVLSTATTGSQALYAKITGTGTKAGTYTDTLTFTASIVTSSN